MTATHSHRTEPQRWPSPPDPGDLSKRVARRRAELRLSREQVAARSGLNVRYLEYLERYPARPSAEALRHLAVALCATPSALLGASANTPPGQAAFTEAPVVEKLTPPQCRLLIAAGGVGHFAVSTSSGPLVLPVNFAVVSGTIVVRTAEGTAIDRYGDGLVAFEVDHVDDALVQGWSVLVRGQAHHVRHPAELNRMQEDAAVWPWPGGEREVYVRIMPERITGRRIEAR
jgi:nitroimidazol reductase NimA-like FMN-containing flavoprotein (pyridoxamine 5'-phosphate oxidase superfamily)